MKPLAQLDACFVGEYSIDENDRPTHRQLDSVEGAQGALFLCPKCENHYVLCWFVNPRNASPVPADARPLPRWTFSGETINELTLSPSIDLSRIDENNPEHPARCYWHGFVESGQPR
jgi:hypothetical protein